MVIARAHTYLIIIGQMLINLADVILIREGVGNAFFKFGFVVAVIQQHGIRLETIATSTTCLLEIGLDTIRTIHMYHHAYIGLVDTHAKGVGGHHYTILVFLPLALSLIFRAGIKACMIECGCDAGLADNLRKLLSALATAGIHNSRALHVFQNVYQLFCLILSMPYHISQILAFKAHLEHVEITRQFCLDIVNHLWRGCGSKSQYGHARHQFAYLGYLQV